MKKRYARDIRAGILLARALWRDSEESWVDAYMDLLDLYPYSAPSPSADRVREAGIRTLSRLNRQPA